MVVIKGDIPEWDYSVKPVSLNTAIQYNGRTYSVTGIECSVDTKVYQYTRTDNSDIKIVVIPSNDSFEVGQYTMYAYYKNVDLSKIQGSGLTVVIGPNATVTGSLSSGTIYFYGSDADSGKYGNATHIPYAEDSGWYEMFSNINSESTVKILYLVTDKSNFKIGLSGT